jgi:hypothetical protein
VVVVETTHLEMAERHLAVVVLAAKVLLVLLAQRTQAAAVVVVVRVRLAQVVVRVS